MDKIIPEVLNMGDEENMFAKELSVSDDDGICDRTEDIPTLKILYLSQSKVDLCSHGLYSDLLNTLASRGHSIVVAEAIVGSKVKLTKQNSIEKLSINVGEQFGVNLIKKGLVLLSLERRMIKAIKANLKNRSFDLVLYATPPITLAGVVEFCKRTYKCKSYLMLKDIFPQNAVDIGMMSKTGLLGIIYKFFRQKEKKLYSISDKIGCLSEANVEYLKKHNKNLDENKIELFPNALSVVESTKQEKDKSVVLERFGIENCGLTFIYGGNLGKPQGLDFLVEGIKATREENCKFIIVGKGSEKEKVFRALKDEKNVVLIEHLPSADYNELCAACDVGIIALDSRFTIPNYPSRVLSYMSNAMPVLACTDSATDIGKMIENEAECGKWCISNNIDDFVQAVKWFCEHKESLAEMGVCGEEYFKSHFNILQHIEKIEHAVGNDKNEHLCK